jgi:hypothetical protein
MLQKGGAVVPQETKGRQLRIWRQGRSRPEARKIHQAREAADQILVEVWNSQRGQIEIYKIFHQCQKDAIKYVYNWENRKWCWY